MEFRPPEKKREGVERVDNYGRAYAGSQRQIQTYVNLRPLGLAEKIVAKLSLPAGPATGIRWVSPLASEKYKEYRDEEFLCALGLGEHSKGLSEFWPKGGPSWDALGVLDSPSGSGAVLVEAKSHPTELQSECEAKGPESLRMIHKALAQTKQWLGVPEAGSPGWTKAFYQTANRYAHLYFLRTAGVRAWLVNVYFLNDPHFKDSAPGDPGEWRATIDDVKNTHGLAGREIPGTAELYLEASEGY